MAAESTPRVCAIGEPLSPLEVAIGLACTEIARAFPHATQKQREHMQRAIAELADALRSES